MERPAIDMLWKIPLAILMTIWLLLLGLMALLSGYKGGQN